MSDKDHLYVRPNGVIYTTAKDLLKDPEVVKAMKRTCRVARKVRDRYREKRDEPKR